MPLTTMTWDGTPLTQPDVEGISIDHGPIGAFERMLSGYLRADVTDWKHGIRVPWTLLTETERDNLRSTYESERIAGTLLVLPDGQSFYVLCGEGSWSEGLFFEAGSIPRYSVVITFDEI